MSHFVGSLVHAPSRPLVSVSDALAAAVAVGPAQALVLDGAALRLGPDVVGTHCAVALAERVAADDECDGLLVVHRHACERLADVLGGGERVGVAVRALGIDVDQAHLHGAERVGELAVTAVALVAEPRVFGTPEDLLGLPDVGPAEAEAERREAHRLHRHVAGQDEQVGPRDLLPVLLLDRPQQAARLVEAGVVGPAVERGEALRALATAAAAVGGAVGAGGVPRHADEQRSVVAVVGRPPVLRVGHQGDEILPERVDVERGERVGVVEVVTQRVRRWVVLVQHLEIDLVRPPVGIRPRPCRLRGWRRDCWVLAFAAVVRHVGLSPVSIWCFWLPAACDRGCSGSSAGMVSSNSSRGTRGIGPSRPPRPRRSRSPHRRKP